MLSSQSRRGGASSSGGISDVGARRDRASERGGEVRRENNSGVVTEAREGAGEKSTGWECGTVGRGAGISW